MHVSLQVKYPLFLLDLNEKYSDVQFHENPSSVCRVVPCGRTDGHDEADSQGKGKGTGKGKVIPLQARCGPEGG